MYKGTNEITNKGLGFKLTNSMSFGESMIYARLKIIGIIFSLQGSSLGQFFEQYLEPIKLNDVHVCKTFHILFIL
jgi:hypothetical protein